MPPLRTIAAALQVTTETLAREISQPTAQAPRWSELQWRIAEAATVMHGTGALLANRLRWKGPDRWQAFLSEQRRQTELRWERIAALLDRIDTLMRQAGIACVALKGSALYRIGLYPTAERTMGDIDLLVRAADTAVASALLTTLGYQEAFSTRRHRTFELVEPAHGVGFGEHVDNPIKIELHERIAEPLPVREIDITALAFPCAARPGINPYPSIASLLRHVLLHAAGNLRSRALRFNQLHDVALLAQRLRGEDWDELLHEGVTARGAWWALAPLSLTARYYPQAIPQQIITAAACGAPVLLRRISRRHRLTDVSWSRIQIQAFPGIEWSGSLAEAVEFMLSRVCPRRDALNEIHQSIREHPFMTAVPWYRLSHVNRILRWVFSQPPRVQAIYPVRVALGIQPASSA